MLIQKRNGSRALHPAILEKNTNERGIEDKVSLYLDLEASSILIECSNH